MRERSADTELAKAQRIKTEIESTKANLERLEDKAITNERLLELASLSALHMILKERGLGVCSEGHHRYGQDPTIENLGIFPTDQLRYHYFSNYYERESEGYFGSGRITQIESLCPQHFPKDPNQMTWSEGASRPNLYSEVVERNGKLFTLVNNIDVTDVPIKRSYPPQLFIYFSVPVLDIDEPYPKIIYYTSFADPCTPQKYTESRRG